MTTPLDSGPAGGASFPRQPSWLSAGKVETCRSAALEKSMANQSVIQGEGSSLDRQSDAVGMPGSPGSLAPRTQQTLPGDMTPARLSDWSRPDSVCLGANGAESARRIRALSYEVLRLQALVDAPSRTLSLEERGRRAVVDIEAVAIAHAAGCCCAPCFYSLAASIAEGRRLISSETPEWFWRRGVSP